MSSKQLLIFMIIVLLFSGCDKETNSTEEKSKGTSTEQRSELTEQSYIELKPYDEAETVKFDGEVGQFIPFSLQPLGAYVPEGLNKAFP